MLLIESRLTAMIRLSEEPTFEVEVEVEFKVDCVSYRTSQFALWKAIVLNVSGCASRKASVSTMRRISGWHAANPSRSVVTKVYFVCVNNVGFG